MQCVVSCKHVQLLQKQKEQLTFAAANRYLMEFICVFSVGGSLASYLVTQKSDTTYVAQLRSNQGKREDIPAELLLEKNGDEWKAQPWQEEIVKSLSQAIDGNNYQNTALTV